MYYPQCIGPQLLILAIQMCGPIKYKLGKSNLTMICFKNDPITMQNVFKYHYVPVSLRLSSSTSLLRIYYSLLSVQIYVKACLSFSLSSVSLSVFCSAVRLHILVLNNKQWKNRNSGASIIWNCITSVIQLNSPYHWLLFRNNMTDPDSIISFESEITLKCHLQEQVIVFYNTKRSVLFDSHKETCHLRQQNTRRVKSSLTHTPWRSVWQPAGFIMIMTCTQNPNDSLFSLY